MIPQSQTQQPEQPENVWQIYEREKNEILRTSQSIAEYEWRIYELTRRLGV